MHGATIKKKLTPNVTNIFTYFQTFSYTFSNVLCLIEARNIRLRFIQCFTP